MATPTLLNVTPAAAEAIKARLGELGGTVKGLRIGITNKGCSGFSYFMEPTAGAEDGDETITAHDVMIVVDPNSLVYLLGTEIDYISSDMEEGFVFKNPNEKGRCGCGESFNA